MHSNVVLKPSCGTVVAAVAVVAVVDAVAVWQLPNWSVDGIISS